MADSTASMAGSTADPAADPTVRPTADPTDDAGTDPTTDPAAGPPTGATADSAPGCAPDRGTGRATGPLAMSGAGLRARIVPVDDPDDARLADYVRLRDVQLRKSLEVRYGLFIAEGEKVIRRAVAAGYPVRSMLMTRRWLTPFADLLQRIDVPVYVVPDAVAEAVTGFSVHRGAMASMARRPLPTVAEVIAGARRLVVLEDLVDHGNVGAIFRCAAALGVDGVLLAPRCADPLYRRAVKVSMGAVFAVPYARIPDWYGGLEQLRDAGFRLLALSPDASAEPLGALAPRDRYALLLGSEGDGLSRRWLDVADECVRIPMSPDAVARGVDSLNVVAAAAIACYALMEGVGSSAAGDRPAGSGPQPVP